MGRGRVAEPLKTPLAFRDVLIEIARAALVRLADIDKDIVAPSATGGEA
jgi:hypothetical protein